MLCREFSQLQSNRDCLGNHKALTEAFAVGVSPSLAFFAVVPLLFCVLLPTLELVPAIGRQNQQYAVWVAATGINALRSVGTGSATRAGKRK